MADYVFQQVGNALRILATDTGKQRLSADQYALADVYTAGVRHGFPFVSPALVGETGSALVFCEPVSRQIGTFWVYQQGEEAFRQELIGRGEVLVPWIGFSGADFPETEYR